MKPPVYFDHGLCVLQLRKIKINLQKAPPAIQSSMSAIFCAVSAVPTFGMPEPPQAAMLVDATSILSTSTLLLRLGSPAVTLNLLEQTVLFALIKLLAETEA